MRCTIALGWRVLSLRLTWNRLNALLPQTYLLASTAFDLPPLFAPPHFLTSCFVAYTQDTINELSRLFERILADPDLKAALVTLVGQLCQDKEVFSSVTDLVVKLAAEERVGTVSVGMCLHVSLCLFALEKCVWKCVYADCVLDC